MVTNRLPTFREASDDLLAMLKDRSNLLDVPWEQIQMGEIGKKPALTAPYILVHLVPISATNLTNARPLTNYAQATILCAAGGETTQAECLIKAVELAIAVTLNLPPTKWLAIDPASIQIFNAEAQLATVEVRARVTYSIYPADATST